MTSAEVAQHLERLQAADLIRPGRADPEAEYWFKHAAVQEPVYGSLLKSSRVDLHRRVAAAVERALPEDAYERAAMLALHYERAELYALAEAIAFYDQPLAMLNAKLPLAVREGAQRYEGEGLYWRGRLLAAKGDWPAAAADYDRARGLLASARAEALLWYVDAALAQAYRQTGD